MVHEIVLSASSTRGLDLECCLCFELIGKEGPMMFIRRTPKSLWDAVCAPCALNVLRLAINAGVIEEAINEAIK